MKSFVEYLTYLIESDNEEYGFIYNKKTKMFARTLDGAFSWKATKYPDILFSKSFYDKEFKAILNKTSGNESDYVFRTDYKIFSSGDPLEATGFSSKNLAESFIETCKSKYKTEFEVYKNKFASPHTPYSIHSVINASETTKYIKFTLDDADLTTLYLRR